MSGIKIYLLDFTTLKQVLILDFFFLCRMFSKIDTIFPLEADIHKKIFTTQKYY